MDAIDRQAAITAIQAAYADTEGGDDKYAVWKNIGLTNALHIMQDLPSAQPEWNEMLVICDNCGHAIHVKRSDRSDGRNRQTGGD